MMRSLAAVSIACLCAATVHAQPPSPGVPGDEPESSADKAEDQASSPAAKPRKRLTKRDKKAAQKRFEDGEVAFEAGEYLLAARAFEEAWELYPLPAIAFSTAQAYRLHYVAENDPSSLNRAVEMYNVYIKEVPSGGRRADAVANLADLEPQLARVGEGSTGRIVDRRTRILIASKTEGAKIRLGDEAAVGSPLTKELSPGTYRVRVEAPGYFPYDETTEVFDGEFSVVKVELDPKPAVVTVKTTEGSTIVINGEKRGAAPLGGPLKLAAGTYIVRSSQSGRRTRSKELELERGQELTVDLELDRTIQRKLSYVVLGTSAVSFSLAALTGLAAASRSTDAQALLDRRDMEPWSQDELARYDELRSERDDLRLQTYGLLGFGAIVGVAGALMYYLDNPGDGESSPAVTPVATPESAGVFVSF